MQHPKIQAIVAKDTRYPYEAYEFVGAALKHTLVLLNQKHAGKGAVATSHNPASSRGSANSPEDTHVSPRQLIEGVIDLARREFGLMAPVVFRNWGVHRTDDFGEIAYNLVLAGLMDTTNRDDRKDFHDVCDLEVALTRDYCIEVSLDG